MSEYHYNWLVNQALATHDIHYRKGQEEDPTFQTRIQSALENTIAYHGEGLSYTPPEPNPRTLTLIQLLLGRGSSSLKEIDWAIVQAMLFKKDPKLLQELQAEIKNILLHFSQNHPLPHQELIFNTAISHIIALLPYSYPAPETLFRIPLQVNGIWRNIDYRIDQRIDLLPLDTEESIPAFGLLPVDANNPGPPLLSFLGTTYPTGDGFKATLLADFTPGHSVGEAPYRIGHEKIKKWLHNKTNVRLFGLSLGGTLALHTMRDFASQIEEVNIYNPPGLYPSLWTQPYASTLTVNIYYQKDDPVATMGNFPSGDSVSIYRILSEEPKNILSAHTKAYTASEEVLITKSTPAYENQRFSRKFLTLLHMITAPVVFILIIGIYLVIFPFLWIGRICWNLCNQFIVRTPE